MPNIHNNNINWLVYFGKDKTKHIIFSSKPKLNYIHQNWILKGDKCD